MKKLLAIVLCLIFGKVSAEFTIASTSRMGNADDKYIFYLHGRIVEDQGINAAHKEHGQYEYEEILKSFEKAGFTVISEARRKNTDPEDYANKIIAQIDSLIAAEVAPENITVVGASKGAWIAILASSKLKNDLVNFVIMGICTDDSIEFFQTNNIRVCGNILSIYENSDQGVASCSRILEYGACVGKSKEIELNMGNGHGFIYKAYEEWMGPTIKWAKGDQ